MILVDGTAWIEYLRASGSPVDARVRELVATDEAVATTDLVVMKVLAGARDDDHREQLRRLLARCVYLAAEPPGDFERAADLHRRCRERGRAVRHLPECVIAVVAMRHDVLVLHADPDFEVIATCVPLRIERTPQAGDRPDEGLA